MALPRYIPQYSVEDYRQWKGDWELWSGVAVAMSPSANRTHQAICGELFFRLKSAIKSQACKDCSVFFELDWIVSEDTVLRPELLIVSQHQPSNFIQETPAFVAEILSESTRKRDLVYKRELYEKLGVKYYLVVEPEEKSCQLFLNSEQGYKQTEDLQLHLEAGCSIGLDLSIFGES